ncbi:hypothetical protein PQO03_14390 [Lentisphaera profundi]|uniref:Aldose epimerase n=1 Tax=Lentisphaera profundi TaxID=1658616 RepID=A0ABY7W0M3_9BACT|nr:hypothetical protein [Lentisphaera profundi]WDE99023.1 hypothetical protein PQO03_14390 [Lentisphaera profundi]
MSLKAINLKYELEYGQNRIEVDSYGAKVLGLYLGGDHNILFYDENDISHSGIPLCFPGFGPLKEGKFQNAGKDYEMNQHGFVRNSVFDLIARGDNFLNFQLESNFYTKEKFPFNFLFQVSYTLSEKELIIDLWIKNQSRQVMPLAPGIHPYFAVKEPNGLSFTSLAKNANNNLLNYEVVEASTVLTPSEQSYHIKGAPDLHLIDHTLQETMIYRKGESNLKMTADPNIFNRMVIWRKSEDSKYVCIEPAYEQNGLNENPIAILPGKAFETRVVIALA